KGAFEHTNFTNIKLFTYDEFQNQYFKIWYEKYFLEELLKINKPLQKFTNFNHVKNPNIFYAGLSDLLKMEFDLLVERYYNFSYFLYVICLSITVMAPKDGDVEIESISQIKDFVLRYPGTELYSNNYHDLLLELKELIDCGVEEFNQFIRSHSDSKYYKITLNLRRE